MQAKHWQSPVGRPDLTPSSLTWSGTGDRRARMRARSPECCTLHRPRSNRTLAGGAKLPGRGTPGEALGRAGADAQSCARRRAAALADRDSLEAPELARNLSPGSRAEVVGEATRSSTGSVTRPSVQPHAQSTGGSSTPSNFQSPPLCPSSDQSVTTSGLFSSSRGDFSLDTTACRFTRLVSTTWASANW